MFSLLYIGLIIAVVIAVVLARAVATAPEGFEDDRGFHELVAEGSESGSADPSIVRPKHAKRDLPSVAATR